MGRSLLDPSKFSHSPRAAGAKRLAKTSRRAVHMASSSYRLLPKVPDEVSLFAGECPSRVSLLRHRSLHYDTSHRITSPAPLVPNVVCERKEIKSHTLAETPSSLFIYGEEKHNRWMHRGFIILACGPYGIAGFKVLSSDWVRVAQSPVS